MTRRYLQMPRGQAWRTVADREPWQNRAACRGDESLSWFTHPTLLTPHELERLTLTCGLCPVRAECFAAAADERAYKVNRAGAWWTDQRDPTLWAAHWLRTGLLPRTLTNPMEDL